MKRSVFILLISSLILTTAYGSKFREIKQLEGPSKSSAARSDNTSDTRAGQSNFSETVEENIVVQEGNTKKTEPKQEKVAEKKTTEKKIVEKKPEKVNTVKNTEQDNIKETAVQDNSADVDDMTQEETGDLSSIPVRTPVKPSSDRNIDLGERVIQNDLAYVKGESAPYTGVFSVFLGTVIEYSVSYKNGVMNGEEIYYSQDGTIPLLAENYKDGKLNGDSFEYYENGKLKTYKKYNLNKVIAMQSFDKSGKSMHKSTFTNGNGTWKLFWENGKIMEEGTYKNWQKDGEWKRYLNNGNIENIKKYNNGKLISETWN